MKMINICQYIASYWSNEKRKKIQTVLHYGIKSPNRLQIL